MSNIKMFEDRKVRSIWNEKEGKWYFSIVDVVYVLTDSSNSRKYWSVLKTRLKQEGSELTTKCSQLKLKASDNKYYYTDCADTETLLRIIQSIPSPKAEPFKLWLARVGYERLEEIENPELAMDRMKSIYEKKGYSEAWIEQRSRGITTRHKVTDEWKNRGAKTAVDFAILIDEIYKTGFGLNSREYKDYKDIDQRKNLRDSMTNIELALTNLGEAAAVEIHQEHDTYGIESLMKDANKAGDVTKVAREKLEEELKRPVISHTNYHDLTKKEIDMKRE